MMAEFREAADWEVKMKKHFLGSIKRLLGSTFPAFTITKNNMRP